MWYIWFPLCCIFIFAFSCVSLNSAARGFSLIKRVIQASRAFEEAIIWSYVEQISAGLNHMHTKRIMHRCVDYNGGSCWSMVCSCLIAVVPVCYVSMFCSCLIAVVPVCYVSMFCSCLIVVVPVCYVSMFCFMFNSGFPYYYFHYCEF